MESYQRLISELLGDDLTPKAQYEKLRYLIEIERLYKAAKENLESNIDWFGDGSQAYKYSKETYDILTGQNEQPEETKPDLFQQMGISANPMKELFEGLNPNKP
jgi:hypothetical protein